MNCPILRTFERQSGHMSMDSGTVVLEKTETVTEPCNVPLFGRMVGGKYVRAKVCDACAKGWTATTDVFANEAEKAKARELANG